MTFTCASLCLSSVEKIFGIKTISNKLIFADQLKQTVVEEANVSRTAARFKDIFECVDRHL